MRRNGGWRRRVPLLALTVLTLIGLLAPVTARAAVSALEPEAGPNGAFEPGSLIVRFDPETPDVEIARVLSSRGAAIRAEHPQLGVLLVDVPTGTELVTAAALEAESSVEYAEPNHYARAALQPDDDLWDDQWGPQAIGADAAWDLVPGTFAGNQGAAATGVPVAILDTGVTATHPDLNDGRVLAADSANCVNEFSTCRWGVGGEDFAHGTPVAAIVSAATNNGVGVAGTAFTSPLIPVKVLDEWGSGTALGVANGIIWAVEHGAKVVNLSLALDRYNQTLCDMVQGAADLGSVPVAAAGNFGATTPTTPMYPAACPGALAVSAVDSSDRLGTFSNRGPHISFAAPGVGIETAVPAPVPASEGRGFRHPSGYMQITGTSVATPHVSGLAALLLSQSPGLSTSAIRDLLARTADKVGPIPYGSDPDAVPCSGGRNSWYGYGRINVRRAVAAVAAQPPFCLDVQAVSSAVYRGETASYTVAVRWDAGSTPEPVSMAVSGLPPGASATFDTNPTTDASQLTITTAATSPIGYHAFEVTATTSSVTTSASGQLVIGPNFSLRTHQPSSRAVIQGGTRSYRGAVDWYLGPIRPLAMSAADLPPGAWAAFDFNPVANEWYAFVATSTTTPTGVHPFRILGEAGGVVHETVATLVVNPPRSEERDYVAAAGDAPVACDPGLGGACFELQGDENAVDLVVADEIGWPVGASYEVRNGSATLLSGGDFCGERSVPVPSGGTVVVVRVRQVLSPLACPSGPSAGTTGTISATFR